MTARVDEVTTWHAGRCFVLTVALLAAFNVARAYGLLGPSPVSISILVAALLLIAWRSGGSLADFGLDPKDARAGLLYGAAALGLVFVVLLVAALIPATNGFLHDSRGQISGAHLVYELGVGVILLTAIPEELAFRGLLLGSGLRLWGPWRASLITSVLFGLWHIAPTLHTRLHNQGVGHVFSTADGRIFEVLGAIAVTSIAGLAFCWLRLRSKSLIASVLAHAATNGLALAFAWFVLHLCLLRIYPSRQLSS
jgi:membrane protease YdiL (CAAX protease family)